MEYLIPNKQHSLNSVLILEQPPEELAIFLVLPGDWRKFEGIYVNMENNFKKDLSDDQYERLSEEFCIKLICELFYDSNGNYQNKEVDTAGMVAAIQKGAYAVKCGFFNGVCTLS